MKKHPKYIRVSGQLYVLAEEQREVVPIREREFSALDNTGNPVTGHQLFVKVKDADEFYVASYAPVDDMTVVFPATKDGDFDTSRELKAARGWNYGEALRNSGFKLVYAPPH